MRIENVFQQILIDLRLRPTTCQVAACLEAGVCVCGKICKANAFLNEEGDVEIGVY